MNHHAIGVDIKNERTTNNTNSFDNNFQRLNTEAPSTFRTPISLVRCSAINDANPNKPKHEINIARTEKNPASFPIRSSLENFLPYRSSTNEYSNGAEG